MLWNQMYIAKPQTTLEHTSPRHRGRLHRGVASQALWKSSSLLQSLQGHPTHLALLLAPAWLLPGLMCLSKAAADGTAAFRLKEPSHLELARRVLPPGRRRRARGRAGYVLDVCGGQGHVGRSCMRIGYESIVFDTALQRFPCFGNHMCRRNEDEWCGDCQVQVDRRQHNRRRLANIAFPPAPQIAVFDWA